MKFRLIIESDEITVITEDGGIACTREAETIDGSMTRIAVTDYYQSRLTEKGITSDNVFEILAEGAMYHMDWSALSFNSLTVIHDALTWLCPGETSWEIVDDLFTDIFGPN